MSKEVQEYLRRGGKITRCPPRAAHWAPTIPVPKRERLL